jgi:glycolate oxidase
VTDPLAALRAELGPRLAADPETLHRYGRDSSRAEPEGEAIAVVLAESAADVGAALGWAARTGTPVSVRGGGTGLAGGANAYPGGLVVSLDRMNRILEIDVENRLARVEPGVVTADLDAAAREHGLFYAPDPASAATSTIGGNIATNAGGLRCIAHGVTREAVAELEVVLPDGRVLETGRRTVKDVVGYDLTGLFVGSEGTLGVITAATVRLKPIPPGEPRTFRAGFDSLEAAGAAVIAIALGADRPEILELMDAFSVEMVESFFPSGLAVPRGAMLVGQAVGSDAQRIAEAIVERCVEAGATDSEISTTSSLLEARRLANPALTARGLRLSCDVGVPVAALATMLRGVEAIAARHGRRIATVAHAGDGNLHSAVEAGDSPVETAIAEEMLDEITRLALELGGTISGEHGIGSTKHHELPWQLSATSIDVHRRIKEALDPGGILSPGRAV